MECILKQIRINFRRVRKLLKSKKSKKGFKQKNTDDALQTF